MSCLKAVTSYASFVFVSASRFDFIILSSIFSISCPKCRVSFHQSLMFPPFFSMSANRLLTSTSLLRKYSCFRKFLKIEDLTHFQSSSSMLLGRRRIIFSLGLPEAKSAHAGAKESQPKIEKIYGFFMSSDSCFSVNPTPGSASSLLCTFPFLKRSTVG